MSLMLGRIFVLALPKEIFDLVKILEVLAA